MNACQTSFLSEVHTPEADIPAATLVYFQERLKSRVYDLVVGAFLAEVARTRLTQKQLAKRIGKRPDVLNRLLATPGNWTLDTVSDLMLGISGCELSLSFSAISDSPKNQISPEWLDNFTIGRHTILEISIDGTPSDQMPRSYRVALSPPRESFGLGIGIS